jgi:hypothetical protein
MYAFVQDENIFWFLVIHHLPEEKKILVSYYTSSVGAENVLVPYNLSFGALFPKIGHLLEMLLGRENSDPSMNYFYFW